MWRSLSSEVTAWAGGCLACQRGKIHRHTRPLPLPIPIPQGRFSHLHVDLVGPLQYSNNFSYIFTIIDRTSKWMEAISLSEMSAAACAKALTFTWISRFGVPETITSDRGPQFTSKLWFQLCKMLNISHKQTTAYHPESNTAVERLHARTHKLSFQMNFSKMMNLQLTPLSTDFPKPCMFLPLLCLGTILAPTCPASCQPNCSLPPLSGFIGAAWFHPFSRSTTAPTWSCVAAPALHHQSRVVGQGGRRQPL